MSAPRLEAVAALSHGSAVDIRSGSLAVRLAETDEEIDAAQALRYRVFYDEMGAPPTREMARSRRDFDGFDDSADHLLVLDHAHGTGARSVIGTYRLIRRPAAAKAGRFYSAAEYDVSVVKTDPITEKYYRYYERQARDAPVL